MKLTRAVNTTLANTTLVKDQFIYEDSTGALYLDMYDTTQKKVIRQPVYPPEASESAIDTELATAWYEAYGEAAPSLSSSIIEEI